MSDEQIPNIDWWMAHPNLGWVKPDCVCDIVNVSSFMRDLGEKPWLIRLGTPYFDGSSSGLRSDPKKGDINWCHCRRCNRPTRMIGTRLCDRCYDLNLD